MGHAATDLVAGLILVALATTLVAHKGTAGVIKVGAHGVAENLQVAEGANYTFG